MPVQVLANPIPCQYTGRGKLPIYKDNNCPYFIDWVNCYIELNGMHRFKKDVRWDWCNNTGHPRPLFGHHETHGLWVQRGMALLFFLCCFTQD